jgi:glucan phosphoethanolaminetransferase (alkaline phosphatase superfamily)
VDGFFAELLPRIEGLNYLLIYTSDHGQNLMDNGLLVTHCTPTQVNQPQVLVPLLVFASDPQLRERFANVFERRRGRSTHFEVFPTLLIAMGYPPDLVQAEYGPSLFVDDLNPLRFYTGDVFGRDRRGQWLEIRMEAPTSN